MSAEIHELTRRQLFGLAAAAAIGPTASTASAQQPPLQLSEDEKMAVRPVYLLLSSGASVSVDASKYTVRGLHILAETAEFREARLIIRNAGAKSVQDLLMVSGRSVTIEL